MKLFLMTLAGLSLNLANAEDICFSKSMHSEKISSLPESICLTSVSMDRNEDTLFVAGTYNGEFNFNINKNLADGSKIASAEIFYNEINEGPCLKWNRIRVQLQVTLSDAGKLVNVDRVYAEVSETPDSCHLSPEKTVHAYDRDHND